jgi:hypothetical protein
MSVTALEKQLVNAREVIERGRRAAKLAENPDFRLLILEGFCLTDCARYAQESADPLLDEQKRADALAMAQAAGHLKRFLSMSVQLGRIAESQMEELNLAIDEARGEEA